MLKFINKKFQRVEKTSIVLTFLSFIIINISQAQVSRLSTYYNTPYQESYQRVATGYEHYLEIKNGKLYACGSNQNGELGVATQESFIVEPIPVGTNENWVTISAGKGFSLGIKADGTLWAWGKNNKGQLGNGTDVATQTPTQVGNDKWLSVSAGHSFALAIKTDGTLWAWGENNKGQLGNGTDNTIANPNPIQVGTDNNWWRISTGYRHSLAIKADGTLWAWGSNSIGQLGNGTTSYDAQNVPIQIGSERWKVISAGRFFSTAIKADGTLWAWGDNYYGQIANGNTDTQPSPTQIGTDKWKSVYAGQNHIVALKSDGNVYSWANEMGVGGFGQPGVITQKTELSGIVQIFAGDSFSFALKSNGELYSWGKNNLGQLGQGNSTDNAIPTFNGSVTEELINVASGHWFTTFALYSNGTIKGWGGSNDVFQLGVDTGGEDQFTPIAVPTAQNNNTAVLTGIDHTLVLKDDGTLWGWGKSQYVGTGTTDVILENATQTNSDNDWLVVTTGSFSSLGIKTDGTLWSWGSNYNGQLGLGDFIDRNIPVQVGTDNNWRTVAMGSFHSLAIKTDGTLWGWGNNYLAQSTGGEDIDDVVIPTQVGTDNDWVYVAAGGSTSFAIKANGTLWGWGQANFGQIGIDEDPMPLKVITPTQIGTDRFIQARVGNWSTLGLKADGTLLAWSNFNAYFGDLGMGDMNNYPTPTPVPDQDNVVQISGGQVHKTVLKSSRQNVCVVGRNGNGELGLGINDISVNSYQCGVAPFDNQVIIYVDDVVVTVQNDATPEITTENGTLQLIATVNPSGANQNVTWSVTSGDEFASVDSDGLVTAISNGTAKIRATSAENQLIFGEIDVTINVIPDVQSVVVTVQNDATPEITTENGTLQLVATVNPSGANQNVIWSVENGSQYASVNANGLVTAIANGIATIRATSVENQIPIYGEIDVVVNITLSIDELQNNSGLKIYPNPTNGIVTIETPYQIEEIIVSNTIGQEILKINSNQIDLSSLKTGIYIIKIRLDDNISITKKVIRN